jgi:TadE-like protein
MPPRPPTTPRRAVYGEMGQATVELVALLPVLAALLVALWQVVLVGYAEWAASAAARAAARADAVGADPARAARAHLATSLEHGLHVHAAEEGTVDVAIRIPTLPGVPSLGHARAVGHFEPQS